MQSVVAIALIMGLVAAFIQLAPYLLIAGIGYLLCVGLLKFLRFLKGIVEPADYVAGGLAGVFPMASAFYEKGWIQGFWVFVFLIPPVLWVLYHLVILQVERSAATMKQRAAADDTTPPGDSASSSPNDPPPPPGDSGAPPETTPPPASPLADLYKELGDIIASGDQSLLSQRISALKRSMDATTFEKNIGAWLRKFNATVQVMETMNRAERTRMDHDFMPLERQKREAELKADIEHHKAREAEARMRQRMSKEE